MPRNGTPGVPIRYTDGMALGLAHAYSSTLPPAASSLITMREGILPNRQCSPQKRLGQNNRHLHICYLVTVARLHSSLPCV